MADTEYKPYTDAMSQTAPAAKAAAIEAYLAAFPQSCEKLPTLEVLMMTYSALDPAKTIDAVDRVLQLDPGNLRALTLGAYFKKQSADSITDPAAKQTALDAAAAYAQKGLTATKPAAMSDADFKKLQDAAFPIFYSAVGMAALNKKDTATAIDAYKKELAAVPVAQTQDPKQAQLPDTYQLALAYELSTPPDLLNCAFYATRFVSFAPEPYKSQVAPLAKYCYKKYHGADDGYDAVVAVSQANLNPPVSFAASVKPAPTATDIIDGIFKTTPDLATLAVGDKEFILQNGTPEQAAKVWDTIKGKSVQLPGAVVVASTPTQLQVAVSEDAVQSKTADFTFTLAPLEDADTPAGKKKVAQIATLTAVGSTVTLEGTYDSFAPKPIMITMTGGAVVLPKAAKPAPAAHAPVHHAPVKKK